MWLPEDDFRIETCWSDFKCINVKFYISALVGVIYFLCYCVYYVKVKFTLEQVTKAQRGSTGIALLFL